MTPRLLYVTKLQARKRCEERYGYSYESQLPTSNASSSVPSRAETCELCRPHSDRRSGQIPLWAFAAGSRHAPGPRAETVDRSQQVARTTPAFKATSVLPLCVHLCSVLIRLTNSAELADG